jgi:hypothetical protein
MDNTEKLIFIYFYICDCYNKHLVAHYQRLSNNNQPKLTDEEVLTIYLYGVLIEKRRSKLEVYQLAHNHLRSWFPDLGGYAAFNKRINNLHEVFPELAYLLIQKKMQSMSGQELVYYQDTLISLVDSMPIMLAVNKRSFKAKVAREYCDKGYCSSKNLHFYGLKLHVMGFKLRNTLPLVEYVSTFPASYHDLTVFKPIWEGLQDRSIFGDKIYNNAPFAKDLEKNNVHIFAPVKKKQGQKILNAADLLFNTAVSRVRQPIESFFNWIIEKVDIQKASKVRSSKGLLTRVYGRFAAAMMAFTFDCL